jgi:hypothetical protein
MNKHGLTSAKDIHSLCWSGSSVLKTDFVKFCYIPHRLSDRDNLLLDASVVCLYPGMALQDSLD